MKILARIATVVLTVVSYEAAASPRHSFAAAGLAAPACPVTIPSANSTPPAPIDPAERPSDRNWLWFGNQYLWTQLPPNGTYRFKKQMRLIGEKVPWYRITDGQLTIYGHRLGQKRPLLITRIPNGYGTIGFQSSGVQFPRTGCWRITGHLGQHALSFVVRVTRASG